MRNCSSIIFLFASLSLLANNQPIELGKVTWLRNMPEAIEQSKNMDKPIFLLFQEVPGCSTCQNFGKNVLSHPLIVEAIESYFVPVAIFNNKSGEDRKVLNSFQEPSWNNPVIRIIAADRKELVPRHSGKYTAASVLKTIRKAMRQAEIEFPGYLDILEDELELTASNTGVIVPSMYCFWTGEKVYGDIDGVIQTEAGFVDKREVVRVTYDKTKISEKELTEIGKSQDCADKVFSSNKSYTPDHTPQYYLSNTKIASVPLSPSQRTKINARIGLHKPYDDLLSPWQKSMWKYIQDGGTLDKKADWMESYFAAKDALSAS